MRTRRGIPAGSSPLAEWLEARQLLSSGPSIDQFSVSTTPSGQVQIHYAITPTASVGLWMKGPNDSNFHSVSATSVDDHTLQVGGLTPAQQYAFELVAEQDARVCYSTPQSVTIPQPSPVITGLHVTGQDCLRGPTIHLQGSWSGTWSSNLSVAVQICAQGLPDNTGLSYATGSGSLAPDGTVSVDVAFPWPGVALNVRAMVSAGGSGSWSDPVTVQWADGLAVPVPSGVQATADPANPRQAIVTWSWSGTQFYTENTIFFRVVDVVGNQAQGVYTTGRNARSLTVNLQVEGDHRFVVVASPLSCPYSAPASSNSVVTAPPTTPGGLRASLGDGKDKVRLAWGDTPAWESGFKLQMKESTADDSHWADAGGTAADVTSTQITLPSDYTGKTYDIRVCAYNSGGNSGYAQTTASGIALQTVSFGGAGFQTIARDNGGGNYGGPQWLDANMNGDIDVGGTWAFSNGTLDGFNSTGGAEHTYPLSYRRSTGDASSCISASPVFVYAGTPGSSWGIKGEGGGYAFLAGMAPSVTGGTVTNTLVASADLPNTIGSSKLEVTWKMTIDGGLSWFEVGKSTNHLYVTGASAPDAPETVLDLGCEGATGKNPDTQPDDVVNGIWGKFSGRNTKRVDGATMTYWGPLASAHPAVDEYQSVGELVKYHDGRCEAWAGLMVEVAARQGVGVSKVSAMPGCMSVYVTSKKMSYQIIPGSYSGMLIYAGHPGQSNSSPPILFNAHALVSFGSTIYDPSYGFKVSGDSLEAAEMMWASASVEGFVYENPNNSSDTVTLLLGQLGLDAVVFR